MPALFALGWLAVWPLVFALLSGCQSGAQQDLVARELRMHEDQIYAMEDYITQYQQLVCKYRSENAELRRRLADDYYDGGQLPAPRQTPPAGGSPTSPPGGTSIEIRETPGPEGQQPPSREIEIDLPDVPPLEGSTFDESNAQEIVSAVHLEPKRTSSGEVASAAEKHRERFSTKIAGSARAQKFIDQSKSSLRLHGEIVAPDMGAGPRLVVNVECVDELENSAAFAGEVSLMLVAPDKPPSQQSLARWDFGPEDVRVAHEDADDERTMRFYLGLPADTPIDQSTELWVRLVPHSGEKLLAHTDIDLALPGGFATSTESTTTQMTAGDLSVAALASAGATSTSARPSTNVLEGDWSIARPGQPAILPSAEEILTGGWRTSSKPIAAVAQAHAIARPEPPAVRQTLHVEDNIASRPAPTYKAPTWSPERSRDMAAGSDVPAKQSSNPSWSATR